MGRPPCFSVVDALSGLFRLEKRSPTLHGSVPLRVAKACVPLLEGNAFGFQLNLTERFPLTRGPLGWSLAMPADEQARLAARHALARERPRAPGILRRDDPWDRFIREEALFFTPPRRLGRHPRLRIFTGLLVRPHPGVCLRLLAAANRRPHSLEVEETVYADPGTLVPLILEVTLHPCARSARSIVLGGELACLAPLPAAARFTACPLEKAPEVGRAHAAFYSPSYFQKKSAAATRRYRQQVDLGADVSTPKTPDAPAEPASAVIVAGPTDFEIVGGAKKQPEAGPEYVVYRNLLDFSFRFDGATVALHFDKQVLARKGQALWQRFRSLYGPEFMAENEGALFYLSKYFTSHPAGEPHFFVKPWAFTRTPPGWSSLIEGSHGNGYDVLRGVIDTDQFHATPAVFAISRADEDIAVPVRTPLIRVFPVPRALLQCGFQLLTLSGNGDGALSD